MIEIESAGWYIFLIIAAAIILFFNWMFLKETKRIQEKLKGMKSFADIIDATNQALDEFNSAFDEAGKLIEKRRGELIELVGRAEKAIARLEEFPLSSWKEPSGEVKSERPHVRGETVVLFEDDAPEEDRVENIKRWLARGKSAEEISRLTGASIREVQLVQKFGAGH